MRISFESRGEFERTDRFLKRMSRGDIFRTLNSNAQRGVAALASATPVDTGNTAGSWGYEVKTSRSGATIIWTNSARAGGPLAIMLQFGHGTGTGGYVRGRDYINPAIRPVFDDIANNVWKAVTSA